MSLYHSAQNILFRIEQMRYRSYYSPLRNNQGVEDMYEQVKIVVADLKAKHDKRMNEKILFNELNVHEFKIPTQ